MAPGGTPDDDLAPLPTAPVGSARRALAIALLVASVSVGLAVPSASSQDDGRLEFVGGPTSILPSSPLTSVAVPSSSTLPPAALAELLPPVIARSSSRAVVPLSDPWEPPASTTSSEPSESGAVPEDRMPFGLEQSTGTTVGSVRSGDRSARTGSRSTTTTDGSTIGIDGTTTTTRGSTTTTIDGTTTTTRGSTTTTTTIDGTTTTTRGSTTTTTQPGTTTTTQPFVCPQGLAYGGILRDQSSFVFDGQSNNLAPIYDLSYPVQLMRLEWPDAPFAVTAVGGTSFDQRIGWAAERTDVQIERLGRPCAVLFDEGGPTDLANDASAEEILDRNRRYIAARRAAGFHIIIGSTVPALDWLAPWQEEQRLRYNALLRQRATAIGLDGLVDVASIPELQNPKDTRYFYDGAHFTPDAAMLVAQLYADVIPTW